MFGYEAYLEKLAVLFQEVLEVLNGDGFIKLGNTDGELLVGTILEGWWGGGWGLGVGSATWGWPRLGGGGWSGVGSLHSGWKGSWKIRWLRILLERM